MSLAAPLLQQNPQTEADLFALFNELSIATQTIEHPAIFTVDEGRDWHHKIPGLHCKNLFLKDKKGALWLVVLPCDKRASISNIEKKCGAARCSFGKAELLQETLNLTAGSVTPFGLINDTQRRVSVVLDSDMMKAEIVNYHPLRNTASTCLKPADLTKFLTHLGYKPQVIDCG